MPEPSLHLSRLVTAALTAAALIAAGTVAYLSQDLPDGAAKARSFAGDELSFVMGSGQVERDGVVIDGYTDGYALLSSGPISLQADDYRYLSISLVAPGGDELPTLFWRRSDAPEDLIQLPIREPGPALLDLSAATDWRGDISELGLLVADNGADSVSIGPVMLEPDSLALRMRLAWDGWTAFEDWSQRSINFLQGGRPDQPIRLPLLVIAWAMLSAALAWLLMKSSGRPVTRNLLVSGAMIFLAAWMLLDLRWTVNNVRKIKQAMETQWDAEETQKLSRGLDGSIYRYIEQLKADVLPPEPTRLLIVGDEHAVDYFLQRAKYHLLPHSAEVTRELSVAPAALGYVIFFGEPGHITSVPGWNEEWQQALMKRQGNEVAELYEVVSTAR